MGQNFFDQFDHAGPQGVVLRPANPLKAQREQNETVSSAETVRSQRLANEKNAAAAPYFKDTAKAERDKAVAEAEKAKIEADQKKAEAAIADMQPNSQVHGDAYLRQFVPPQMWNTVKAYARGDLGSRSGGLSTSMLPIIQHAMNYDPNTSGTNFAARVKMQQDLAGSQPGTAGGALRAMERMLLHGREVLESGEALNNYGPGFLGSLGNKLRTGYEHMAGDPTVAGYDERVRNYAPEAQKAIAQTTGGVGERGDREAAFAASLPQAARVAALQGDARQALDAMGAVNSQYRRLMGRDITDMLSPEAKAAYDKIMAGGYDAQGKPLHPAAGWTPISGAPGIGGNGGGGGPTGGGSPNTPIDPSQLVSPLDMPSTPTDHMPRLSPEDEKFIAANAPYMSPEGMAKWFGERGLKVTNTDKLYAFYNSPNVRKLVAEGKPVPFGGVAYDENAYKQQLADYNKAAGLDPTAGTMEMATNGLTANAVPFMQGVGGGVNSLLHGNGFGSGYDLARDAAQLRIDNARNTTSGNVAEGAGMVAGATKLGDLTGEVMSRISPNLQARVLNATSPFARNVAEDATFGALQGQNANGDPLSGAGAAAGGNIAGAGGSKLLGGVVGGVTAPVAKRLASQGVPVNFGQIMRDRGGMLGRTAAGAWDALSSVPILGDAIRARNNESIEGFNKAVMNIAGAPINANVTAIGPDGVAQLGNAVSDAYSNALDGMILRPDAKFRDGFRNARINAKVLDPSVAPEVLATIKGAEDSLTNMPPVTGRTMQGVKQDINRQIGSMGTGTFATEGKGVLRDVRDSLFDLAERQDPANFALYRDADKAHGMLQTVQNAVNRASGRAGDPGVFTPAQMGMADKATDWTANKTATASGATPFSQIVNDGVTLLPSQLADSGTARRLIMAGALAGGSGAADYIDPEYGVPLTLGSAALLGLSKPGQKLLRAGMLGSRGKTATVVGKALKGPVGDFIGSVTGPLALQYSAVNQ